MMDNTGIRLRTYRAGARVRAHSMRSALRKHQRKEQARTPHSTRSASHSLDAALVSAIASDRRLHLVAPPRLGVSRHLAAV